MRLLLLLLCERVRMLDGRVQRLVALVVVLRLAGLHLLLLLLRRHDGNLLGRELLHRLHIAISGHVHHRHRVGRVHIEAVRRHRHGLHPGVGVVFLHVLVVLCRGRRAGLVAGR